MSLVETMLHESWQPRSRNPRDRDLGCLEVTGWAQESLAFHDAAVQLLHAQTYKYVLFIGLWLHVRCACAGALSRNTESLPETLRIADSIMTPWSSIEEVSTRYHQNFLLCNNDEVTACNCRFMQQFFLWKSACGCIFQGSAATNCR